MMNEDPKLIVALYLRGERLDPDLVTRSVRVPPSSAQKKDETYVTQAGREFKAKVGFWSLTVELDSPSLDEHLLRLADSLPGELSFSSIEGVDEAYVDIFMAVVSDVDGSAKCELDLSHESLERLAHLGVPVRISMTAGTE